LAEKLSEERGPEISIFAPPASVMVEFGEAQSRREMASVVFAPMASDPPHN
jgi:hypothetical protein